MENQSNALGCYARCTRHNLITNKIKLGELKWKIINLKDGALFSNIAWCLWQRQNRLRENQLTWQLHELGNRAKELVLEYLDEKKQPTWGVTRLARVRWTPPTKQNYKGNFDAAFFYASGCVAIGVVFWDHTRNIIAALSQKILLVQSVELAEALVARRAVVFAKEPSLFNVEIEGDCSQVIKALTDSRRCSTLFGHMIDESRSLGVTL